MGTHIKRIGLRAEVLHWWVGLWVMLACLLCANIAQADDLDGGFIWQVAKQGQAPSFLIGTIHAGKTGSKLPHAYQQAIQNTKTLIVESSEDDWEGLQGASLSMALQALMKDKQTLQQNLGKQRLQGLNQVLSRNGSKVYLDADAYLGTWVASMLVMTDYNMPDYSTDNGVDVRLMQLAKKQGKAVVALETLEPLLLFKNVPEALHLRIMDEYIKNHQAMQREQLQMARWYDAGNSRALIEHTFDVKAALRYYPKQDHRFWQQWMFGDLLQQRNTMWLPQIDRHLKRRPTTIAVGAAHLFGGSGLIVLLREQGYQVTPYRP